MALDDLQPMRRFFRPFKIGAMLSVMANGWNPQKPDFWSMTWLLNFSQELWMSLLLPVWKTNWTIASGEEEWVAVISEFYDAILRPLGTRRRNHAGKESRI